MASLLYVKAHLCITISMEGVFVAAGSFTPELCTCADSSPHALIWSSGKILHSGVMSQRGLYLKKKAPALCLPPLPFPDSDVPRITRMTFPAPGRRVPCLLQSYTHTFPPGLPSSSHRLEPPLRPGIPRLLPVLFVLLCQ